MPFPRITVPPADPKWANPQRWRLLFTTPWKKEEHINVLEARTIVNFARHLARKRANHGNNILVSTDSMVSLGGPSGKAGARRHRYWLSAAEFWSFEWEQVFAST